LTKAVEAMGQGIGAVRGNREEINPEASVYNWIGNLEWNAPPGECEAFGGDVLIRRSILEETGGYDEILVGGEDPDLSRRVRLKGWKIIQLDEPMTRHDLAMTTWRQYWKRAYRTGYAYGAVATRSGFTPKASAVRQCFRILVRGGGPLALLCLTLLGLFWRPWSLMLLIPAVGLLFLPRLFRVAYFERDKGLSPGEARRYAWHCALVVVPEFFGTMRFFAGKALSRPLRNKRRGLQTRRSDLSSVELEDL
jgi:hypothetical protein